jgi:D-sedoheptulose 7-phosphate isomerase
LAIVVPSPTTARIQEAHIFIGHTLCALVEAELGLA